MTYLFKSIYLFTLILLGFDNRLQGQDIDAIKQFITLDSITVIASQQELDIDSFITYIVTDQSFYSAFKNLRSASYDFSNWVEFFPKKKHPAATYNSRARQTYTAPCRQMIESDKVVKGDFYEKTGDYHYYTAKLYDRLFFTHGLSCVDTVSSLNEDKPKGMERHVAELKKLMFSPGVDVRVPLLGSKTTIFEKDMMQYYDYSIAFEEINQQACYRFTIDLKPEYRDKKESKTVIKKLQTWFDQSTHQIVKRKYRIIGKTIAYSFDVMMDIDVISVGRKYFPSMIQYDGNWKIIGRPRENAKFVTLFSNISY